MLQNWLMLQFNEHIRANLIFQHNQAVPHYHNALPRFLNEKIPICWVGHKGPNVQPARSPDLIPKDYFFFWECIKNPGWSLCPSPTKQSSGTQTGFVNLWSPLTYILYTEHWMSSYIFWAWSGLPSCPH